MDISGDKLALQRIREAAEKAKIELSSSGQTDVNLPYLTADASGPKHLQVQLNRAKFESIAQDLVSRTLKPLESCLKDSGLSKD
jgi:molecular chaperone DnaK